MSTEYQSELHTLCDQSKWVELSSILNSILGANNSGCKLSHQKNETNKNNLLLQSNVQQQTPNSRLITPGAQSTSHTISTAPPSSSAYNEEYHRKDSQNSTSTTDHINSSNPHKTTHFGAHRLG